MAPMSEISASWKAAAASSTSAARATRTAPSRSSRPSSTVLNAYLLSRSVRFPTTSRRRSRTMSSTAGRANAPLFIGHDGHRITRGALQYRVLRAFKLAGPDAQRTPGALVHALRHTYATELANTNISVYTLMKLLGHESMATSQRYVISAGSETKAAAAQNPLYDLAADPGTAGRGGSRQCGLNEAYSTEPQ